MSAEGIVDNRSEHRFELSRGGELAQLVYALTRDRLFLVHTEVPDAFAGQGLGGALVRAALARAAEEGLTIVPNCPFARRWLQEHPEAIGDVAVDWSGFG